MTALSTELWQPTPSSTIEHIQRLRVRLNEESIIDFIAGLSPWIAPLPSAVFVQQAANRHLHSGEPLSWVIAIVIETLGLTTTHTALAFHGWNKTHSEKEQAPFGLAVVLAAVYVGATLSLIGVLEAFPELNSYAPLLFPVLAVVGAVNLAMRGHHNQRVKEEKNLQAEDRQRRFADEDAEKELKREERRMKMIAKYAPVSFQERSTIVPNGTVLTEERSRNDEAETILGHIERNGYKSLGEISKATTIPKTTVSRIIDGLTADGKLHRIDDNGKVKYELNGWH